MNLPEITEVQRLTLKPGDRLIVRVPDRIDAATAARMLEVIRGRLGLPDDARIMILDRDMSMEVVEGL